MKVKKYLNTKNLSKILAFGILLNSIPINSFASILSEDGRYETFKDSNITVNNILEEDKINIEIEGNTLINLATVSNESDLVWAGNGEGVNKYIKENGVYRWEKESPNGHIFHPKIYLSRNDKGLIEPNKTYTIQYKIKSSQNIDSGFCIANGDAWLGNLNPDVSLININNNRNNKEVIVKKTFTTNIPTNLSNNLSIGFTHIIENAEDTVFPQWVEISDLVILEGDWSNKEMPPYFEGMKSVGELENNKINVEKLGENLFDKSYFTHMIETYYDKGNYGYEVKDGKNTIWATKNHNKLAGKNLLNNNYKFKENTQYIVIKNIKIVKNY